MPDAPGLELLRGEIERDRPGAVLATSFERGQAALIADPARILDLLGWLKEQPGHRYDFLSSLHVADYLPAAPRFGVHYELLNRDRCERLRVKASVPIDGMRSRGPTAAALHRLPASSSSPPPTSRSAKPSTSSGSSSAATPT